MNKFVVDSCIFAKLFLQEDDREKAVEFFITANSRKWQILVPTLFKSEFLNIVKCKQINFKQAYFILEQNLNTVMDVIDIDKSIMEKTLSICKEGSKKSGYPSTYDSTYHALAILNNCDFITVDNKHYNKTQHLGNIKLLKNFII